MPAASVGQLFDRLAHGKAPALIVLLGADRYWLELCRKKLVESLVPEGASDWAVTRLSAGESDLEEVLARAQMRPMLAPRQLVFVSEADLWERGEEDRKAKRRAVSADESGAEPNSESGGSSEDGSSEPASKARATSKADAKKAIGQVVAALAAYLKDPAPFTVLVFDAEKLDQRTRFAHLLAEHGLIVQLEAAGANPAQLAMEMARGLGVALEPAAAVRLAEATAGRAARMSVELEKLACYAGERKTIAATDVAALVVEEGSSQVWEFADLFAAGERRRALELLDELMRRGETAPRLVGALAWMYRKLLIASELPQRVSQWEAAKALSINPQAALDAVARARRFSPVRLRESLIALGEADDRVKSRAREVRATMEFLVARLTRPTG